MIEDRFDQRPGWMLAVSRVVLALAILLLSALDPGDPGFQVEPDDLLASAYLVLSIVILAVR